MYIDHSFTQFYADTLIALKGFVEERQHFLLRHDFFEELDGFGDVGDVLDDEAVFTSDFLEVAELRMATYIIEDGIEEGTLVEDTLLVADKLHLHEVLLEDELLAAQAAAKTAQENDHEEFFAFGRHGTETVFHTMAVGFEVAVGSDAVELAVEEHPLAAARNVIVGEIHLEVALDGAVINEVFAGEVFALFELFLIEVLELIVLKLVDGL